MKDITIDVHGLKRLEAREYIINEINKGYKNKVHIIHVIHGYNNGSVIKNWISNSKDLLSIEIVNSVMPSLSNSGETLIILNLKKI